VRLVLVDDDQDTREMYCTWLEHVGFEVFDAEDAETAFVHAVHHQPRVVVTDHALRGGPTGAQLCERLKDDPRTEHIRTLLMTGSAERRTVEGALTMGCAAVRLKPYLPDAMLADIEAIIRGEQIEAFPHEHDQP
jgi:DNA-binding response OmpR family regulator